MPATVAKEGTATWLPVLTWLPGQLPDPPQMTNLHASFPESSTRNRFSTYSSVTANVFECLSSLHAQ